MATPSNKGYMLKAKIDDPSHIDVAGLDIKFDNKEESTPESKGYLLKANIEDDPSHVVGAGSDTKSDNKEESTPSSKGYLLKAKIDDPSHIDVAGLDIKFDNKEESTPESKGYLLKANIKDDPSHVVGAGSDTKSDNKEESNATELTTPNDRRPTCAGSNSDNGPLLDKADKHTRSSVVKSAYPADNPRAIIMPIIDPNADVIFTPQVIAAAERLVSASALVHQDMIDQKERLDRKIAAMEERLNAILLDMRNALLDDIEDSEVPSVKGDEKKGSGQA